MDVFYVKSEHNNAECGGLNKQHGITCILGSIHCDFRCVHANKMEMSGFVSRLSMRIRFSKTNSQRKACNKVRSGRLSHLHNT